jgi:uncharacterized BrkB/YihY/UPF0761 family membrane protein
LKLKVFLIGVLAIVSMGAIGFVFSFIYELSYPPEDFDFHDSYFVVVHINWPLIVVTIAAMIFCFIIYKLLNRKSVRK